MIRKRVLVAALAILGAILLGQGTVVAQEDGPPPLPILYQGEVYSDGELLREEAQLTVRVGDWESRSVTVQDGKFQGLVAGPPGPRYIGQPITFHLGGVEASYRSTFPLLGEPRSEEVRLEFAHVAATAEPQDASPEEDSVLDVPWAALAGMLAGGAVLVVVLSVALRRFLNA